MGFLGAVGRGLAGAAKGFVRGGPVGAIIGGARGVKEGLSRPTVTSVGTSVLPSILPSMLPESITPAFTGGKQGPNVSRGFPGAVPEPGFKGALQRFLPGGQSGFTGAPPGYHVNKAYLRYLRAESMGKPAKDPFKEARAVNVVVRNRKMNPLNPRALRRANARQVAAVRLMRRTLRGTGYQITRHSFGRKKGGRR